MPDEKKATAEDVIATLRSIDERLRNIHELQVTMAEHAGVLRRQAMHEDARAVPAIASDADLDGKWGNPEVKAKDPRDWTSESMKGRRFSECPAPYLDLVADRLDYFAERENDPKKARYNRLDASRARGWAARIRAGYVAPQPATGFPSDGAPLTGDDVPF